MLEEENQWESSDSGSGHSEYDFNNNSVTVASLMLPIFASGGKKKPKKKKGKGKATPAPKTIMSWGVSKTTIRQQMESEYFLEDEERQIEEMPQDVAEKILGTAVIKVMEGHFAKLYSKIDNLKMEVSMLKTTVVSLVEENKKLGEVRGNAPDPEKQPPATPVTPKKDLTIRPRTQLQPRKWVGTSLAREVLTRNWEKQVKKDNATPINID
jgi:hypothetical protein